MSFTPLTTNTLLAYALDTLPNPLQASPANGTIVYAALTFSISNNSNVAVSLSQVQFTLPVGTLAQDLTNDPEAVLYGVSPQGIWNISMTASGVYTAVPASGTPITVTTSGIIMQLYNIPVNQQTGTVSILVSETASSDGNPSGVRQATFSIAKFPYGFFFRNFVPNTGQVPDNTSVTLTWEGSDIASYSMVVGAAAPVDVTNYRTWVSPALTVDTTFLLTASVVAFGQTVTATQSVTVTVANPQITATSLSVSGASNLQGATTVGGTLNANSTLTVAGAATLNNALNVGGASTLSSLTVNQQLTASGGISSTQVTAGSLGVSGAATISGNATVGGVLSAGNLSAVGSAITVWSGTSNWGATYTAQTDGMIVGYVAGAADFSVFSAGIAFASTNGAAASAQGGSICLLITSSSSSWSAWNYLNTNSLSLLVRSGATFSLSAIYPGNTATYPQIFFYWIPFGSGGVTQIAAVADHPECVPKTVPPIQWISNANTYSHAPAVTRLMDVLTELFGERLDPGKRVRLSEAIKELVYEEGKETKRGGQG